MNQMAPLALRLMRVLTRRAVHHLRRHLFIRNDLARWYRYDQARKLTMQWAQSVNWEPHLRRCVEFEVDDETGETALRVRRMSKHMSQFLPGVVEDWIKVLYDECRQHSGTQYFSLDELAEMGHPYGLPTAEAPWRMPGVLGFDDALINLQTGEFFEAWEYDVVVEGDEAVGTVRNTAAHAQYLTARGTEFMRPRDIMGMAYELARQDMNNAVRRGIYALAQEALQS